MSPPHATHYPAGSDEFFMAECLELAELGLGWASPNPQVGALIVRDGEVIGRGAHRCDGSEHAEVSALAAAGDARGATCYTTLEPCSHQGRQPACTTALISAGVSRVVYGTADADPRSSGRAQGILEAAGIHVSANVLHEQCARVLDYYLYARTLQRPFLHVKVALSADGKMACANGASQWLSGPVSLGYAHYLRQKYDAIMVAYRTVLADDPRLSARSEEIRNYVALPEGVRSRNPVRIVLDPRFELCDSMQQLNIANFDGEFRSDLRIVLVGYSAYAQHARRVEDAAVRIAAIDADPLRPLPFAAIAQALWELGLQSVLIEGGAGLISEMMQQRAASKLSCVYTPLLIGADGLDFMPRAGYTSIDDCPQLTGSVAEILGNDVLLEGYPMWPER